jgi:sugar/nucleoside kinase (ribokinase family)
MVDRHRPALKGFIGAEVDILFANEAEITSLYETDNFDAAIEAVRGKARIVAVTRGAAGSVVVTEGEIHQIEASPVEKVVDTTGAGDQYAAGFLFGLARGHALDHCGRLGSLAAAEVISHYGPRPQASLRDLATAAGL